MIHCRHINKNKKQNRKAMNQCTIKKVSLSAAIVYHYHISFSTETNGVSRRQKEKIDFTYISSNHYHFPSYCHSITFPLLAEVMLLGPYHFTFVKYVYVPTVFFNTVDTVYIKYVNMHTKKLKI